MDLGNRTDRSWSVALNAASALEAHSRDAETIDIHSSSLPDGFQPDGASYLLGGYPVHELKQSNGPELDAAGQEVGRLAIAVRTAHELGIVHQDPTPMNVVIVKNRRPELIGFGLTEQIRESDLMESQVVLVGTPAYMAPEPARDYMKFVSHQSDIYSFGSTLHHYITHTASVIELCFSASQGGRDKRNLPTEAWEPTQGFLDKTLELLQRMDKDIALAILDDPAAKSLELILNCYLGGAALRTQSSVQKIHSLGIASIRRMTSEHAPWNTGIDIHPVTMIGRPFFIDHGTGVVIGDESAISDEFVLYQGITVGAPRFPRNEHRHVRHDEIRRHPTTGKGVVIYAKGTILGGDMVIGDKSAVGASTWIEEGVEPGVIAADKTPSNHYINSVRRSLEGLPLDGSASRAFTQSREPSHMPVEVPVQQNDFTGRTTGDKSVLLPRVGHRWPRHLNRGERRAEIPHRCHLRLVRGKLRPSTRRSRTRQPEMTNSSHSGAATVRKPE